MLLSPVTCWSATAVVQAIVEYEMDMTAASKEMTARELKLGNCTNQMFTT